ncbi:hypothetical protein NL64_09230 [Pseudomonas fluorescens]|uniref:DUF1254 domain-containing protein n=1 Tax=Pseudomonas fluorescens TaxID=294 RepID=UPI00054C61D8|nr:DUF1254 domain-containing protein [Pseudomonas fluorescens]KII33676.1 hypothetical protein NL64_09230 [Pseudomonas fluorescens]
MRHCITALVVGVSINTVHAANLDQQQAKALAQEAYVFAYATAEHNKVLNAFTAKLPFNYLHSEPRLYGPGDNKVVSPNNDTFYTSALLDLRAEPQVLQVPAIDGRYYSFQLVDMRTDNLDYIGTRATGNKAGRYLIAGPDWQGELPPGFSGVIRSPSRVVFLLGRTEVKGEGDQPQGAQVLKNYVLQPLSKLLGTPTPAALPKLQFPTYEDSKKGPAVALFSRFNALAALHEWTPSEQQKLSRFGEIGIKQGAEFTPPQSLEQAVIEGAEAGREQVRAASSNLSIEQQGWSRLPANVGKFGEDDLTRAAVAWRYIYANDQVEALYPVAMHDIDGQSLDGHSCYQLSFPAGQLPPVDAFWSLTMYDGNTQLLVENSINRYSIGDRTPNLRYNSDEGLTIFLQSNSPGKEQQGNWLPTPVGPFNLLLRLYLPQPAALDGRFRLPMIKAMECEAEV